MLKDDIIFYSAGEEKKPWRFFLLSVETSQVFCGRISESEMIIWSFVVSACKASHNSSQHSQPIN